MNKRTALLKQVACKNPVEKMDSPTQPMDNSNIHEFIESIKSIADFTPPNPDIQMLDYPIKKAAGVLEMDPAQLIAWLDLYPKVPLLIKLSLLHIIARAQLDPFLEEVVFSQYEPNQWEAVITVNGWSTLANRSPVFSGINFMQGPEDEHSIPTWIECSIYRADRALPITVREYFSEVKAQTEAWKKLPRRMLRHKAFSQCARLAFGLPYLS